ncbi:BnaCnng43340D [Brassica napus]|uniref:BnaC09g29890D protein n=4 Tax=Brassica TaxID=3705 RepID=A0A078G115_BRANA|nr:BnaC09g29890D [Brassica napus]CDY64170.1 BnaCnng43340D [Brassica napus]
MLFFNGCLEFTVSTKCPYLRHLWRSLWSLSKLQSLFLQSLQHLKLLQWFHLDCVEITEMPYI